MNQTQTRSLRKKVLSLILAVVMAVSLLPISAFASGDSKASTTASTDEFVRIFHLDCGRKYFSVNQIKDLIDAASASNYTHVELAIGNDALRFLLDDMSVTANGTTYSSEKVKTGIQTGNKAYYNAGSVNELTQSEMDTIISYAKGKNISIIPLLNSPGHMDAIIDCMETLGMSKVAFSANWYGTSARTIDLNNTQAVAFTQALVKKYVEYFAGKGCEYFNMGADEYANDKLGKYTGSGGAGFGYLIDTGDYSKFVTYVNNLAAIIKDAGKSTNMKPIAFNDGIYYNKNTTSGTFDTDIIVSYWTSGYGNYTPASASFLANKGHKIINTNDAWYYVLNNANSSYTYSHALSGVKGTAVTDVPGSNDPTPMGCMLAFWCDEPSAQYNDTEAKNVKGLISTLAANNKSYFTAVSPAEPEILTSTGSTTLDVNGGSTTLSVSDGAEATWTVDPSDGSVIKLISASNADGDSITGSRVEAVATGKGMATITATVGTKAYTMKLTVADPNEVPVEVPAGSDWTTTVKDVDLRNQVGDYDESVAKVKVSYDKKDGGITFTPVTSVSYGTAYYIQNSNGEYLDKDANWVADSTSAAEWTWDNYYLSCDGSYLRYSSGKWTTSTSRATRLYFNNGMFYGSRSLDWNGYTYSNLLGQPGSGTKADPVNASTITITGVTAGQETTVKIGDVTYRIKVTDKAPDNAMTASTINLECWITNFEVYETQSKTGHTKTITTSTDGATADEGIAITDIAPDHAYSFFDGTKDVYYWQAMRLDKDNQQTKASGDDETSNGTTLTHIRYYGGAWQYKTVDGTWHYFVSTDQLVAYYLQKVASTKEVTTYVKDWGFSTTNENTNDNTTGGQVALTIAVVYPDGSISPAEGDMYQNSTTILNYWEEGRDIGIVAPINNSDYNISKITVTDGARTARKDSKDTRYYWYKDDSITWQKKTLASGGEWYDETTVWDKSKGTTPMVNGKSNNVKWTAKNTAKLVLIYLEPIVKDSNLNVVYQDDNTNTEINRYQIVMSYNQGQDQPTFDTSLKNSSGAVIGTIKNWPGKESSEPGYLPDDAYVTNSSQKDQKIDKNLATITGISGIYASGLYEYVGADISEDGKTLTLHYNLKNTSNKTFVMDFGLPLQIPTSEFGITNFESTVETVSFDQDKVTHERDGNYGHGSIDVDRGIVTYTLTKALDQKIPIPVYVTFKNDKNVHVYNVYVIPATSVYYEDSFATFTNADGTKNVAQVDNAGKGIWTKVTDGTTQTNVNQALEELGGTTNTKNVYGYDPAYADSSKFSMGSATKVTVNANTANNGQWPTATFTFKGTGFDVISLTNSDAGTVMYTVTNAVTNEKVMSRIIDNYYGYTYENNQWVVKKNDSTAPYQVPVIKISGLDYGTYTVTISVIYGELFDNTRDNQYSFWLDAVRVYNPAGNTLDSEYTKDGENNPNYVEVKKVILDSKALETDGATGATGAVFIDGKSENVSATEYANQGPNHEAYLAKNQAIAFQMLANETPTSVQIGAKLASGDSANLQISGANCNKATSGKLQLRTATDMYYELAGLGWTEQADGTYLSNVITLTNTGAGIVSLTNIKFIGAVYQNVKPEVKASADETTVVTFAASEAMVDEAVAVVDGVINPVIEPFNPDRFDVSWSRNVRKGDTAKLTVKTSEDVEAITVNGETIDSYVERNERTGWGWWAKTVTYREFTYTTKANVTEDFTVCAVNAEGVSSEAKTATLTVRPSVRDWLHGIIGKWF